jgi:hypothetical protein
MMNMKKQTKLMLLGMVAGVVLVLAGCPQQTSISDITRDPGAYMNKEVTVVGTVNRSYGLLGNGVYELSDGSGSIWVLSEGYGVPSDGVQVGVTGTVIPTLTFGGKSYATGIRESRRRSHP